MCKKENIKNTKYLCLVLILVIVILYALSFGKFFLNDGDHGRDLLSFLMVSEGKLPYIDFHWIYGPLMPFYYGLLFKIFSPSILLASAGWYLIFSITILMFYITVKDSFNSLISFITTLLFVVYHSFFFHTFNHIAGTLMIISIMFFFIRFIRSNKIIYLHLTSICMVILGLIKLNMLLALLISCFIIVYLVSKKELIKFIPAVILPLLVIYGWFIFLTTGFNFDDNFPYAVNRIMKSDTNLLTTILKPLYISPTIANIKNTFILIQYDILYSILVYFIVFLCSFVTLFFAYKDKKQFYIMLFLVIASFLTVHEFIIAGTDYSLRMWTLPILLLSITYSIMYLFETRKILKKVIFGIVTYIAIFGFIINVLIYSNDFKYLDLKRAKIKVYPVSYVPLIIDVTNYIKNHTSSEDHVLTIPYNTLYLFLADRKSPSKQNEFLYLSGLNEKKEIEVIKNLKSNNTPIILYSNMVSEEFIGTGYFGKTHCKKLSKYIHDNYTAIDIVPEFFDKEKHLAFGKVITFYKKKNTF